MRVLKISGVLKFVYKLESLDAKTATNFRKATKNDKQNSPKYRKHAIYWLG